MQKEKYNYSDSFRKLLKENDIKALIDANYDVKNFNFDTWEAEKSFIGKAINKDGTIIDVGCGNGFLLRSLQEWSGHRLTPYGIDVSVHSIAEAKSIIFPESSSNFIKMSYTDLFKPNALPKKFDFVIWSVWYEYTIEGKGEIDFVKRAEGLVNDGGRLILQLYAPNKEFNLKRLEYLGQQGFHGLKVLENPNSAPIVAWIQK